LSKTVKVFKIESFSHDSGSKHPEFVDSFTETGQKERPEQQQPSTEEQARKIFEDAFVQGEKAGHEMGMKKVEQVVKRLNYCLAELEAFRSQLIEQAETFSVELALAFAEALVLKECSEKRDLVMGMAKRAFEICEDKCDIVIRVRREEAELLSQTTMSHIKIVPDDTLKEPGFIIETGFGDIDGRISTQLEELKKEFLHELHF
jgi:flagellar assembly protein FliH